MNRRIVITTEALRDLAAISRFIRRRDSLAAAQRMVRMLKARMADLALAAESFPLRDELAPGIRGVEYKRYLILFRVSAEEVRFTNVVHAARDVRALLSKDRPA